MNRGTALKWINQIKTGKYTLGNGQLRYRNYNEGFDYYDPLGVLADFLDPSGWKEEYIGYSWHNELFKMPEDYRKKCKIKTPYLNYISDNGYETSAVDMFDSVTSWDEVIFFIEKYSDQF